MDFKRVSGGPTVISPSQNGTNDFHTQSQNDRFHSEEVLDNDYSWEIQNSKFKIQNDELETTSSSPLLKHPPTPFKGGLDPLHSTKNSEQQQNPSLFTANSSLSTSSLEGGGPQGRRMSGRQTNIENVEFADSLIPPNPLERGEQGTSNSTEDSKLQDNPSLLSPNYSPFQDDNYREKYFELLNRQLAVIRQQNEIVQASPRQLAVSYATSPAPEEVPIAKKTRFHLGTVLGFWATAALVPVVAFWGVFEESLVYGIESNPAPQVAGVSENLEGENPLNQVEYEQWIRDKTGLTLDSKDDQDHDGLTNGEEFLLHTNPLETHTCGGEKNDLENLLELIDPINCEKIDLDKGEGMKKFEQVIDIPTVAQKLFTLEEEKEQDEPIGESLYDIFEVDDLSKIDYLSNGDLQREIELSKKREEYSQVLARIDQYITDNRSYDEFDRNYGTPVDAAIFLETSIKYDVPLKYVLTIARLESRFGTDRYTNSGNLTRPGAHKNIYSIGLDDSGNNLTYNSWNEGVYGFGRWYRYFDDKGVPDCRKWRIYNPNGDYCSKVEKFAAQAEAYIYD